MSPTNMYCAVSSQWGSLVRIPNETRSTVHQNITFTFLCIRKLYILHKYIRYFVICFITELYIVKYPNSRLIIISIKPIIIGVMTSRFLYNILYESYF